MERKHNGFFLLIIGCCISGFTGCWALLVLPHIVKTFESVLLEGCYEKGSKLEWTFDNSLLFVENTLLESTLHDVKLLQNGSVVIDVISLNHAGNYTCIRDSTSILSHNLHVEGLVTLIFI